MGADKMAQFTLGHFEKSEIKVDKQLLQVPLNGFLRSNRQSSCWKNSMGLRLSLRKPKKATSVSFAIPRHLTLWSFLVGT